MIDIPPEALALIERFEGCILTPYQDVTGTWTIGYGTVYINNVPVGPDTPALTLAQAQQLLLDEVQTVYAPPIIALGLPLNVNEFSATLDLVYNVGPGVLDESWVFGSYLRAEEWLNAADAMLQYDTSDGEYIPDLAERRQVERTLFLTPVTPIPPLPRPNPLNVLTRTERGFVDEYDADEKHPCLHKQQLALLKARIALARAAVYRAAVDGVTASGKTQKGWHVDNRIQRYNILKAIVPPGTA